MTFISVTAIAVGQQLDESWTLTLNGITTRVQPDGSYLLPNVTVPDDSPADFLSDDCYRVTGISLRPDGSVLYGWSDSFRLTSGQTFFVGDLTIGNAPGHFVPQTIRLTIANETLVVGATPSLLALEGDYVVGSGLQTVVIDPNPSYPVCVDEFGVPPSINFTSSNPSIASVDSSGQVFGNSVGRAYLTARYLGLIAITEVLVTDPNDPLTEVVGFIQLEDGTPVPGANVKVAQGSTVLSAFSQGPDGRFSIIGARSQLGPVRADASATVSNEELRGVSVLVDSVPAGQTDVGIVTIHPSGGANRDFVVCFPRNWVAATSLELQVASEELSIVQMQSPGGGMDTEFFPDADTLTTFSIPLDRELVANDRLEPKGISITSTGPLSVYGHNRRSTTVEGFVAFPTSACGTSYRVMTYGPSDGASAFAIVAIEDGTQLTISPTAQIPGQNGTAPYQVALNRFDAYQAQTGLGDLTGTLITADKPVAVFGAHTCARVPNGAAFCDHLVDQLPPLSSWGTDHYSVPLLGRTGGDTFRVLASTAGTNVIVDDGSGNPLMLPLTATGEFVEFTLDTPARITADQPVLVAQFAHGAGFDGATADPFMMVVPPPEHWRTDYHYGASGDGTAQYVNIVAPLAVANSNQVTLDGLVVDAGQFTMLPGGTHASAQLSVTLGQHRISAPQPIGLFCYGFGPENEGYGFPGALDLPFGQ